MSSVVAENVSVRNTIGTRVRKRLTNGEREEGRQTAMNSSFISERILTRSAAQKSLWSGAD